MNLQDVFNENIEDVPGPIIYRIVNNLNGKSYIGQTRTSLLTRFVYLGLSAHKTRYYDDYDNKLYNAIRKFGIENFSVEVLPTDPDVDLDTQEIDYIAKYNSCDDGYNNTIGGQNFSKEAQINGAYMLSQKCMREKKGAFYNEEEHKKACSLGGYGVAEKKILKTIELLKQRGLEINQVNFNKTKAEVSHNTPRWETVVDMYSHLLK